jgi:hypothetical protein
MDSKTISLITIISSTSTTPQEKSSSNIAINAIRTRHQILIAPIFFISIIFFGVWDKAPTWNLFQALT